MPPFQYSEAATPCPSNWKSSKPAFTSFEIHDNDDDTAALDFTTDLRSVLQQNPRRVKRAATFKIHEDAATTKTSGLPTATWRKTTAGKTGSSMFSQPAQRLPARQRVSFAPTQVLSGSHKETMAEKKPNNLDERCKEAVVDDKQDGGMERKDPLKKNQRRGTIYIPPDDTTVPTMFMSIFSPLKTDIVETSELGNLEAQIAKKHRQRKRPSETSQRAPLQQPLRVEQESAIQLDVAGSNTGKENVPPGASPCTEVKKKKDFDIFDLPEFKPPSVGKPVRKTSSTTVAENEKPQTSNIRKSLGKRSTALQQNCPNSPKTRRASVAASNSARKVQDGNVGEAKVKLAGNTLKRSPNNREKAGAKSATKQPVKKRTPAKLVVPRISNLGIAEMYPVLTEDISNPQMYEENWLAHQEIVITQLVNSLFDSARGVAVPLDADTLRHELLEHYQDAYFSMLYKRVQASLLYGALRVPKDVLRRGSRLKDDIGMRRKFLDLWLTTYDLSALRSAAETVVGRRILVPVDSPNSTKQRSEKVLRRSLEAFLETFLVRNEDVDSSLRTAKAEDGGAEGSSYCRTLLRSIMMIMLLDKARMAPGTSLPSCLFVPSSEYKTSAVVLQALGHMLLPSVGDIARPLSHLDYQVQYEQHRLQEYEYRIQNLAVDLRDGVLLTRLVELLLFSGSDLNSENGDPDSTTIITIPSGQILSLLQGENDWPLSQHLKIPCTSRATKVFNVHVALSALSGVRGVGIVAEDIRPEDIVDGYREKTIAVLWGLVGKWGLPALVDWDDLSREITRLRRKAGRLMPQADHDDDAEDCEYGRETLLLKEWASCLAELKGNRLENLTTSFADGSIFESIVDEYEAFISPGKDKDQGDGVNGGSKSAKAPLAARLRRLGCSSQFASLVAPSSISSKHIFDKDFTLGALAFLCSRLLSASKRVRATVVIQSAWRNVLSRRKAPGNGTGAASANSLGDQERVLWAKGVIVRWWRSQKCRKKWSRDTGTKRTEHGKGSTTTRQTRLERSKHGGKGNRVQFDVNGVSRRKRL